MPETPSPANSQDDTLQDRIKLLATVVLRRSRFRLPDPTEKPSPRAVVILIRGICSWPDDYTFEKLEPALMNAGVAVKRFSYAGNRNAGYWSVDTFRRLKESADILDALIDAVDPKIPLICIAHSLGGILATYMACRTNLTVKHIARLRKIRRMIFVTSPVFLAVQPAKGESPRIDVPYPANKNGYLRFDLEDYPSFRDDLLARYSNLAVFYIPDKDGKPQDILAPEKETSFLAHFDRLQRRPLDELPISGQHFDACNHPVVVEYVKNLIEQTVNPAQPDNP